MPKQNRTLVGVPDSYIEGLVKRPHPRRGLARRIERKLSSRVLAFDTAEELAVWLLRDHDDPPPSSPSDDAPAPQKDGAVSRPGERDVHPGRRALPNLPREPVLPVSIKLRREALRLLNDAARRAALPLRNAMQAIMNDVAAKAA